MVLHGCQVRSAPGPAVKVRSTFNEMEQNPVKLGHETTKIMRNPAEFCPRRSQKPMEFL